MERGHLGGRLRRAAPALVGLPAALMAVASLVQPLLDRYEPVLLGSILSTTCHRIPSRCIPLPWGASGLCARCTAFWAGMALLAAMPEARRRIGFPASVLMLVPMIADGLLQYAGFYESTLLLRTSTGFLAGAGFSVLLLSAAGRGDLSHALTG